MTDSIKNLLVTGAAGFIGSNFVKYMLDHYSDIRVISLDKLTYAGDLSNLSAVEFFKNHIFVQGDIGDEDLIVSLLRSYQIDTIVHFAAESHVDNSISNPGIFLQTNIMGTFTLLEATRKYWLEENQGNQSYCRFHHVSTDEVYGSLAEHDPAFTENHPYQPNSPYSASKASSDHLVRAYFHTFGLPVTTSNCSNNYGPNQHKEKLIPKVIHACLKKEPITVYGTGKNIRDWLFVLDHCEALDIVLRKGKPGEVYNIGGQNERDNLSLIQLLCHLMNDLHPMNDNYESLIVFTKDRKGHDQRYAINNSKIKNELGWTPKGEFQLKLIQTITHYIGEHLKT